jgi:hypothetical protein
MKKDPQFVQAIEDVIENLESLRMSLNRCVNEGMIDYESAFYNQINDLIDDAEIVKTWDELIEIITRAKTIEVDVDAWLSVRGSTTISMLWPKAPHT